jgi:hypothetical protein
MRNEIKKIIQLVLPTGRMYEVRCWDSLRQHDTQTKLQDDWFWHLTDITVIT